jgi:protoporphyrinogen oxidase
MQNGKIAIIGAGSAGITAAYELTKAGMSVDVYEARDSVGGLAKTIDLWNQRVDLGPHRFFSRDKRVNELWIEAAHSDYVMVPRLTRIYYKGKFFFYPLKAFNALQNLGVFQATACLTSYIAERLKPTKQDGTFENWVVSRFGRKLFEIFFKTYSEKLWGISCKELDADFAAQRIKKLSLFEAIKNALLEGKNNKYQTLLDQFAYPNKGSGIIYENIAAYIIKHGGRVLLNTPVKRVLQQDGKATAIELIDGCVVEYEHIISSMPLSLLVTQLPNVPLAVKEAAHSLKFRNTILVYLNIDSVNLFLDNWLYIHDANLQMGRITNFRNWTPGLYGKELTTIIAIEYWCYDVDKLWTDTDDTLINLAKAEFKATGLLGDASILAGHVHKIKRCYPVYETGYKQKLKPIEEYLSGIKGLSVIGRYGSFKYNNQDHSILMGILAAENIAKGTSHNLWEINTDYESYQESTIITTTGLKKTH